MICAEVVEWAERYEGEPFHALLCDPPYNFQFMSAAWDDAVAMHPETWTALSEHLCPGAFVFAFGGARTYHRLAVALEDAGLRIHPAIGWVNGQGFPKSTRVDTQVDKAAGKLEEREVIGRYQLPNGKRWNLTQADDENVEAAPGAFTASGRRTLNIKAPVTPLAQAWEGHRYGGQVLKPCLEFIAVAQKPYEGRPVNCITKTGAGTLWVDGSRVGNTQADREWMRKTARPNTAGAENRSRIYGSGKTSPVNVHEQGRWPSNFLLQHITSETCSDCNGAGYLDFLTWYTQANPDTKSFASYKQMEGRCDTCGGKGMIGGCREIGDENGMETVARWECVEGCPVSTIPNDKARYFFQSNWNHEVAERLDFTNPVFYCPKAARRERDTGLHDLSLQTFNRVNPGGLEREPRWAPTEVRNPHPTVKPITLTRYLATLLLPPDLYVPCRLLVPFAGVASEMIGAHLAGWEEVVGIEMSQEYCDIGEVRLDWWKRASEGASTTDVKEILKWAKKQM